jgi:uridine kinase
MNLMLFIYAKQNSINLDNFYKYLKWLDQKENWLYFYELYKNNKDLVFENISELEY